jgi:GDPmannose 4,6-dehydratase
VDLASGAEIEAVLQAHAPAEIYNLAAQSNVAASFKDPIGTAEVNAMGALWLMQAVLSANARPRLVHASTAEIFGSQGGICDESTPVSPNTPYACAKAFAHQMLGIFRTAHALPASAAILFAHESPYRGAGFLTRKVTMAFAAIKAGRQEVLELGNMNAERDWGFAGDYVAGMRLVARAQKPEDFVLASGEARSVRAFVIAAASAAGFDLVFEGEGLEEVGRNRSDGRTLVRVNPEFFRPVDVARFVGVPRKAEEVLGWRRTMSFEALVGLMVEADIRRLEHIRA